MTREIALHCMKSASELERELCEECPIYGQISKSSLVAESEDKEC